MRRIVSLVLLVAGANGCAALHEHALGTRVRTINVRGVDYVHCSILLDPRQPQMIHDSLEVCRDGIAIPQLHQPK